MRYAKALVTLLALAGLSACIVVPYPRHGGYGYGYGGGRGEVVFVEHAGPRGR